MPIPIFIQYGQSFRQYARGWFAMECPECECVRAFRCDTNVMSEQLYFISVREKEVGDIVTCDFCGSSFALDKGIEVPADSEWHRGERLQALVDRTAPELGQVEEREPTDEQIDTLLTCIRRQASMLKADAKPGIILGCIAGVVVCLSLGMLLRSAGVEFGEDGLAQGMFSVIAGLLAGSICGSILWNRRQARKLGRQLLTEAIIKHKLDRAQLAKVIDLNPSLPGWMRAAAGGGATTPGHAAQ